MSTSKVNVVVDNEIAEFDFDRAIPSPLREQARKGMRFHIVSEGSGHPVYHVSARRRARSWWIEIEEIEGSGRSCPWSDIETVARQVIAGSRGEDTSDVDLVIDLPPIK